MSKVTICDLLCAGEFGQESIDGAHMQGRDKLFQLWEKDADKTRDGLFQPGALRNFVKSVSG